MDALRARIIESAERQFDEGGFAATGMDRLTAAANVSTRTLYKHVGSKDQLVVAALERRHERFFSVVVAAGSVDDLFRSLERWVTAEGARGCLFLRAAGESRADSGAVVDVVARYHARLRQLIGDLVAGDTGRDDDALAEQVLVLFEGATSAASYRGAPAVEAARVAARTLLAAAGSSKEA